VGIIPVNAKGELLNHFTIEATSILCIHHCFTKPYI